MKYIPTIGILLLSAIMIVVWGVIGWIAGGWVRVFFWGLDILVIYLCAELCVTEPFEY